MTRSETLSSSLSSSASLCPASSSSTLNHDVWVAVIGAGISGLTAATHLWQQHQQGVNVIVFEASDRVGGRIWTHVKGMTHNAIQEKDTPLVLIFETER